MEPDTLPPPVTLDRRPDPALSQHPAAVYAAGLSSPTSRRTMWATLNVLARLLTGRPDADALAVDWAALRYAHLVALRSQLQARYSPATVNRMLSAVRGVLRAAFLLDQIDGEAYRKAIAVESVPNERLPAGRDVDGSELARLVALCRAEGTAAGARDAAILAVLYGGGLRRAECCALELADYDPIHGKIIIRHGKGGRQRAAYLPPGARAALRAWLNRRGSFPGRLFVTVNKADAVGRSGFSTTALYNIIRSRAAQAGLARLTPHDLRRTHVTRLLDAGADALLVSRIAGHRDPKTTARYDRRGDSAAAAAADLLDFPYPTAP